MNPVQVTYASLPDIRQALSDVRGSRYYMPRYAWIAEAARFLFILIPVFMVIAGLISEAVLLAFIVGYLLTRIFEKRLKPLIYRRFGADFMSAAQVWPMQIHLDETGLNIKTPSSRSQTAWAALPLPELRKTGLLIRIEPERTVPIRAVDLPNEVTSENVLANIREWRTAK
ncbi:MAG: hypothetical protein AAFP85_02415 [Pseudomonadota bacterium]